MKRFLMILLFIFLTSCSEESTSERYFANCVKDLMEHRKAVDEDRALEVCARYKNAALDEFKYYKGRVFSKKR